MELINAKIRKVERDLRRVEELVMWGKFFSQRLKPFLTWIA